MQYGFQRLVLLGSAGYSRAELPLDGSVSLVAPNNIGKTSLINALQFLLIIHRSRMDFGAHNFDASRRFYFPNNSAYVMLEISLPETGTVVLGCVGKGVSFDYEYFAYAGSLNVEEFCLPNGQLVAQPQLINHLANHGRRVFAYNSSDFADMIYGGRRSRSNGQQDFCVFRLEHANDASVFQRVMTRTLRLDKLTSREVKDYLLKIFKRDLPDAGIDFKAEWDKAFADLNTERAQYLAAVTLKNSLDQLESKQQQRKILRGKIIYWRPLIEEALSNWQQYYQDQKQQLQSELEQCSFKWKQQREDDLHAVRSQTELEVEKKQLLEQKNQLQQLQQRFMLINNRSVLESNRDQIAQQRDDLVVSIGQAQNSSVHYTKQQLQRVERELAQINQEISTQGQNLYQHLSKHLSHSQLVALNKVFSRSVLTLGTNAFRIDERALLSVLNLANEQNLELPGLSLNIGPLLEQHQQLTAAQLQERQQQILQEQHVLKQQLVSAQALEEIKSQRSKLEQELKHIDNELQAYQSMEALLQDQLVREERLQDLGCMIESLVIQLAQAEERNQALHQMQQQLEQKLITLEQQHKQIEQRRDQRIDQEAPLSWVSDLPHQPWLVQTEFQLHQLAEYLQSYLNDCKKLVELDEQIRQLLSQIHIGGLTKYQLIGDEESEIERLIAFAHHLPQEAEALEKKARSAVVNVAACLRELRDGLLAFKRRMREFNRKISGRQLSDLAVFKIEPEDEAPLVEAIELLIKTATTVDTGEVFDLFNQQSVLDDVQINRAKTLLIEEGNARNGLHITDLFHLRFWVGKANQEAEAFDDLDSAASNGTVLMAKLVTGLAMLHLMQDQRRPIQGVCYLDEALALDSRNQRNLIEIAAEFGFSLIFASPAPLTTVRYCVPIHQKHGKNHISRFSWQIIETLEATS